MITAFKVDAANYRLVPFQSDGRPAGEIDLRPMLAHFLDEIDLPSQIRNSVQQAIAEASRMW